MITINKYLFFKTIKNILIINLERDNVFFNILNQKNNHNYNQNYLNFYNFNNYFKFLWLFIAILHYLQEF
jgi:hypothetical protein